MNYRGKPDYCHCGKLALTKNDILGCAEKTYLVLKCYPKFFEGLTMYNKKISSFALKESCMRTAPQSLD